jgi:hypothetical protein
MAARTKTSLTKSGVETYNYEMHVENLEKHFDPVLSLTISIQSTFYTISSHHINTMNKFLTFLLAALLIVAASADQGAVRQLSTSKSTKAPTLKSTKAPTTKSTKAPTLKSTKGPKSTKAPTTKSTKAPTTKSTKAPSSR